MGWSTGALIPKVGALVVIECEIIMGLLSKASSNTVALGVNNFSLLSILFIYLFILIFSLKW